LLTLFEAARWAPSHYNSQPWRFSYGKNGTAHFGAILASLVPSNQLWASKAGALVVVISQVIGDHDGKPLPTHSFDAGAAWMSVALQASTMGLFAHGMGGFDHDATAKAVQVPPGFKLEMVFAVGAIGSADFLPDFYKTLEAPNDRRPTKESIFEGPFHIEPKKK
jgi:nitroreductase